MRGGAYAKRRRSGSLLRVDASVIVKGWMSSEEMVVWNDEFDCLGCYLKGMK